jgi:hypothetical protein
LKAIEGELKTDLDTLGSIQAEKQMLMEQLEQHLKNAKRNNPVISTSEISKIQNNDHAKISLSATDKSVERSIVADDDPYGVKLNQVAVASKQVSSQEQAKIIAKSLAREVLWQANSLSRPTTSLGRDTFDDAAASLVDITLVRNSSSSQAVPKEALSPHSTIEVYATLATSIVDEVFRKIDLREILASSNNSDENHIVNDAINSVISNVFSAAVNEVSVLNQANSQLRKQKKLEDIKLDVYEKLSQLLVHEVLARASNIVINEITDRESSVEFAAKQFYKSVLANVQSDILHSTVSNNTENSKAAEFKPEPSTVGYLLPKLELKRSVHEPANLSYSSYDVGRRIQMYSFQYDNWENIEIVDYDVNDGQHKCLFEANNLLQCFNLRKKPIRAFASYNSKS